MWKSEDNVWELVYSSHDVHPGDWTQVLGVTTSGFPTELC